MLVFNRDALILATAETISTETTSTIVRCLNLCVIALNWDISEAEKLALAKLPAVPARADKIAYDRYTYVNKLCLQAAEIRNCTDDIKAMVKAVDTTNAKAVTQFQVEAALKGFFINTGSQFNAFIAGNFTEDAKAARAKLAAEKAAKKAPVQTVGASNAAPDSATVPAAITAQAESDAVDVVNGALLDTVNNGGVVGEALAAALRMTDSNGMAHVINAWQADRAELLAQVAELQAKLHAATAPRSKARKTA